MATDGTQDALNWDPICGTTSRNLHRQGNLSLLILLKYLRVFPLLLVYI